VKDAPYQVTHLVKLRNRHLPANLLASFVKRHSRLSLNAPPAAVVMVVPFTYNFLKRPPALMPMIHRTDVDDPENDPYLTDEENPLNSQAQLGSLWELMSHRAHYHAGVSTLMKIFSGAFTKPRYAMEDFLDHTYGTLFEAEANRKIKKEPALAVQTGKGRELFPVAGAGAKGEEDKEAVRGEGDVVDELWVFA